MDKIKTINEKCHYRHENPLRQRRTQIIPDHCRRNQFPQIRVHYAARNPISLLDLEQANISIMPIGRAPVNDGGPRTLGGERFSKTQRADDWEMRRWYASWGIQVYTGQPSALDEAVWHDIDFSYEFICAAPAEVIECLEILASSVANPLLTITKSGGIRFSCRVTSYLHPDSEEAKQYICKHIPTTEDPYHQVSYVKIFGEKNYSRWDARYEIFSGNILNPPIITKEILFATLSWLRSKFHSPLSNNAKRTINIPSTLGSANLDLAKDAFVQRGYTYLRDEENIHYWTKPDSQDEIGHISLWEHDKTVWVRAAKHETDIPTEPTPITNIWEDTGIVSFSIPSKLQLSQKVIAIQRGELSPLSLKRDPAKLNQNSSNEEMYMSPEQMVHHLENGTRILGLTTEQFTGISPDREKCFLNKTSSLVNLLSTELANSVFERYQTHKHDSIFLWKERNHLWEKIKDIPIEERFSNPFQHGNVCEDVERCEALEKKGGNPNRSLCPNCHIYTECQQRGYLSQFNEIEHKQLKIIPIDQLFFNPDNTNTLESIMQHCNETENYCVPRIHGHKLFTECSLSVDILKAWSSNLDIYPLCDFAKSLLHILSLENMSNTDIIRRIRSVVQAFKWQKKDIIKQIGFVRVQAKVLENSYFDDDTGLPLANYIVEFNDCVTSYIPYNENAKRILEERGVSVFPLHNFSLNETFSIFLPMADAIELGIFDISSIEKIKNLPEYPQNPNWTFWHQLDRFFKHYTRDADAPLRYDENIIRFWVPPVLPPQIERLILISTHLPEEVLHRTFPNENTKTTFIRPITCLKGNQIFQIRSQHHTLQTFLSFNDNLDFVGLSKMGKDIFARITSEIKMCPQTKHVIITHEELIPHLDHLAQMENVSCITYFDRTRKLYNIFNKSQVFWIVGTPNAPYQHIRRKAQILFGNDDRRLVYDEDPETSNFIDDRIQSIYEQRIVRILKRTVLRAQLNDKNDRKVVIFSSVFLPGISNRSETLLFDWEDLIVADTLDELPKVIKTRQHYELQRSNLSSESSREEVEQVIGCSSRQASYFLQKLRGKDFHRVTFREQILSMLENGEKHTSEFTCAIKGHPKAIMNELKRLVKNGKIRRVKHGYYALD